MWISRIQVQRLERLTPNLAIAKNMRRLRSMVVVVKSGWNKRADTISRAVPRDPSRRTRELLETIVLRD